jgi:hypothetical protein
MEQSWLPLLRAQLVRVVDFLVAKQIVLDHQQLCLQTKSLWTMQIMRKGWPYVADNEIELDVFGDLLGRVQQRAAHPSA